ncbi:UNVERIFIED_CONTAM: hypothetical protein PYX00_011646 [Menopon gallinae]|uniref:Uncharacterized protein n=1 Tax=Menopon gallinae TaxID=328185 RepID=A0AAW2H7X2_9NEOP
MEICFSLRCTWHLYGHTAERGALLLACTALAMLCAVAAVCTCRVCGKEYILPLGLQNQCASCEERRGWRERRVEDKEYEKEAVKGHGFVPGKSQDSCVVCSGHMMHSGHQDMQEPLWHSSCNTAARMRSTARETRLVGESSETCLEVVLYSIRTRSEAQIRWLKRMTCIRDSQHPLHTGTSLRTTVLESVPESKHNTEEILDIWRGKLVRYAPFHADGRDMESYTKFIYSIDIEAFKGWRMYEESVPVTRDLVEAVVSKLVESRVDAEAYVSEVCEALLYCPDRQMATLNMVYGALYAKRDVGSFECFVENEIATLKRHILDIVVTPGSGTQNVHVQNYWRYKLREKLGYKGEYKPRMGTFDQGRLGGHVGNVLDVFYTKFTPKYVVEKLVEEINRRKERLMGAGAYLSGRLEDESYKRRVFEFENEEDADLLIPSRITHSGVEDILERMGIIERGVEETSGEESRAGGRDAGAC